MKFVVNYWEDRVGGKLTKKEVEAYEYRYKVGPAGGWKMLISDEDKDVKAHVPVNIRIKRIMIQEESIVFPCFFMRHALGFVETGIMVGVPKKIEEQRSFEEVIFHPIADGVIHRGELLGVMNVFYAHPEYQSLMESEISWADYRYRY